jgi:uncharacterized RDD family membrane protein YckC
MPPASSPNPFAATVKVSSEEPLETVPKDSDRWLGVQLDHFLIEKPLGYGGMGEVYEAKDCSLERQVALKLLPEQLAQRPELTERFIREARAQAQLSSAHVVQIHYIGQKAADERGPATLFFAMELVRGGSLEGYLVTHGAIPSEQARMWMIQVAMGLHEAHTAGIIHRDIKPSNLLLTAQGQIKIADFGLAKPLRTAANITQKGTVLGSPMYMAPEQANDGPMDHRVDMYALGGSFYHLLQGTPPFEGKTPMDVVSQHISQVPPPLKAQVPKALRLIVERLLAKRPEDRFVDYEQLLISLHKAAPKRIVYAGFWTRAAAVLIDCAFAASMIAAVGSIGLYLHLAYITLAHAWFGQTFGKYALKIRVVRSDGSKLGLWRSLVRTLSALWLPFFFGVVILVTKGRNELEVVIGRMSPGEAHAFQSLVLALAIGNAVLTCLWLGGLLLATFHPQKKAVHDIIVGSSVQYRLQSADGTSQTPFGTDPNALWSDKHSKMIGETPVDSPPVGWE